MNSILFKSVLCADLRRTSSERNLLPGHLIHSLFGVSGEALLAGTPLRRRRPFWRHSSLPQATQSRSFTSWKVLSARLWRSQISKVAQDRLLFLVASDDVARTRGDISTSGLYARCSTARRPVSLSVSLQAAFSAVGHTSRMADVKSNA